MKPNNPYQHNPMPAITRSLEDGPDYQPDWRNRVVQQYLLDIAAADPDRPTHKLTTIMAAEPDEHVIELLLFHLDRSTLTLLGPSTDYAVRCVRTNAKTQIASKIKAMILAGFLTEEIAIELGTDSEKIDTFEWLFFDVRRYRGRRAWLDGICKPPSAEACTPEEIRELRFLQIALVHGKAGVREDILGHCPPNKGYTVYPPVLARVVKKSVERAADYYLQQDIAALPSEMDFKVLRFMAQHAENFERPIFANQVEDQPKRGPTLSDAKFKNLLEADWETINLLSASIVNTLHAQYRKLLRAKLAAALEEAEKSKTDFSPPGKVAGENSINWGEVLQGLDQVGFGGCKFQPAADEAAQPTKPADARDTIQSKGEGGAL